MSKTERRILVTGGLGFIGSALVDRLICDDSNYVAIVDNMSKAGAPVKLPDHPRVVLYANDVADERRMGDVFLSVRPTHIYHLAAQTSIYGGLFDPDGDFHTNAIGTWTMLRLLKKFAPKATFIFASSNKVYGSIAPWQLPLNNSINDPATFSPMGGYPLSAGVDSYPLDPTTPYAVSKASADMMVRDAARKFFGLKALSIRQSTIYGPRQYGSASHGWVSNLMSCVLEKRQIQVSGDGHQVRDLLYVDDLIDLYVKLLDGSLVREICTNHKAVLDVGGGRSNAASVLEVIKLLAEMRGADVDCVHSPTAIGDQPWFIADIDRTKELTGWYPTVGWQEGVAECYGYEQKLRLQKRTGDVFKDNEVNGND